VKEPGQSRALSVAIIRLNLPETTSLSPVSFGGLSITRLHGLTCLQW